MSNKKFAVFHNSCVWIFALAVIAFQRSITNHVAIFTDSQK